MKAMKTMKATGPTMKSMKTSKATGTMKADGPAMKARRWAKGKINAMKPDRSRGTIKAMKAMRTIKGNAAILTALGIVENEANKLAWRACDLQDYIANLRAAALR